MSTNSLTVGDPINTDHAVRERYSSASKSQDAALCCPVIYDPRYLSVIPQEIIDRDYGCGDPSPYVAPGDTVVDLGSGGGKLCFIISQQVGPSGRVIGVDFNPDMLKLARDNQAAIAAKIGHDNVEFRCGRIQDLAIDLEELANHLKTTSVDSPEDALNVLMLSENIRQNSPMITDNSADCVVSNCVLNLVRPEDRKQLFAEIFRVLKPGGHAAISDIVSDEDCPESMQNDPKLWSGCISGAWREDRFIDEFEEAGFVGMMIDQRQDEPWQTVQGIEFRSVTIVAYKPFQEVCLERNQAVMYRGPFKEVRLEDGHIYPRGQRMAVCDRTYRYLLQGPYKDMFYAIDPIKDIPLDSATKYDCKIDRVRDPKELKGRQYNLTIQNNGQCCGGSDTGSCC